MIVCDICKVDLSSASSFHQTVTVEPKITGVFAIEDSTELEKTRHFCGGCAKRVVTYIERAAAGFDRINGA